MKSNCLFMALLCFLSSIHFVDAATLYSRKSGNWDDNNVTTGTWSTLGPGMAACGCVPTSSDSIVIASGDIVDLNTSGNVRSITVAGTLQWTTSASLTLTNSGIITVLSSGVINENGQADANLSFADASVFSMLVNSGGMISIEDIEMDGAGSLTIDGLGDVSVSDDINFNVSNSSIVNNLSGSFDVNSSIVFRLGCSGASFTNNDSIDVTTFILFGDVNNTFTNGVNGVINQLTSGSSAGISVSNSNMDGNVLNNNGSMFIKGDISPSSADFTFNNSGMVDMDGDLRNGFSSNDSIKNLSGALWKMSGGNPGGVDIYANYDANTFQFDGATNTFWLAAADAFWHVIIDRRADISTNITLNGDLTVNDTVRWNAARTLTIGGNSNITINSGGRLDGNGQSTADLRLNFSGTSNLIVNAGASISLEDITLNNTGTLNISGSGDITLSDDVNFDASAFATSGTVVNNLTGNFTINSSIAMRTNGGTFINNDSISVGNVLFFAGSNNNYTNGLNGILNLISNGIVVNASSSTNNTVSNTGTFYINGAIDVSGSEFEFNNFGLVDMDGEFLDFPSSGTRDINNLSGSTWRTTSTSASDADMRLFCNNDANTFVFDNVENQIMLTPQDGFWHLRLSGGGAKRPTVDLDVNGDLTIDLGVELDMATNGANLALAGNWIDNGSFTEASQTVMFDGTSPQAISGAETFFNFTLNNSTPSNALTLNSPVIVEGTLTLTDGHIVSSSSNALTLSANASLTLNATPQDSSFIKGPMNWIVATGSDITRIFPIGKNDKYRRVDLAIDQDAATPTMYSGEVHNESARDLSYVLPPTINRVSDIRYWQINKGTGAGVENAQVTLFYGNDDLVTDPVNLVVVKDDGSGNWINLMGTAIGAPAGSITSEGFTAFSDFTLANNNAGANPLPVTWLDFELAKSNRYVNINWSTASEVNNDYFTVERSRDATNFVEVGKVLGNGNSRRVLNYSFIDREPGEGQSYYRIKQTDFDGSYSYTAVKSIIMENQKVFQISPNPTHGNTSLSISFYDNRYENVNISLINTVGSILAVNQLSVGVEGNTFSMDISDHKPGMYFLKFELDGLRTIVEKLIVN